MESASRARIFFFSIALRRDGTREQREQGDTRIAEPCSLCNFIDASIAGCV